MSAFDRHLAALAEIGVTVGVNLQASQELIVTAPLEASPLVQHVARCAYDRGATLVTCLYDDPALIAGRLRHAVDCTLDAAPGWLHDAVVRGMANGAARLYIVGPYPDLLAGTSPEKMVRVHRALAAATATEGAMTAGAQINWSTLPYVTDSWAIQVFPGMPPQDAAARLWDIVFEVTRVTAADPCAAWATHVEALAARRKRLDAWRFDALRFHDERTDLTVGLAPQHRWIGGTVEAANGVHCVPNVPTEEIFTCPDRRRADGRVAFSRPVALGGSTVRGLVLDFKGGAVTRIDADEGREIVEALVASDAGATRLGEVGLVPRSSPLARAGVLFYSALFDENAATHLALGRAYAASAPDGDESAGNESAIHLDLMFGSDSLHVDGLAADGSVEPVMRHGEFVF